MEVSSTIAASYQQQAPKTAPAQTESSQPVEASSQTVQTAVAPQQSVQGLQQQAGTNQDGQQGQNKGQRQPTQDEIKSAISHANKHAHFGNTSAQFSYHEKTKRISVKIFDKDTNEVIREIPPEETLDMIAKMYELAGLMIDEKR
ncbi:MAG: flagellar protein FlaG [Lachnospiraceae bacterium]|nr:flagellar protein FlaG [Lachnospiraceae bacterium]